MKIVVANVLNLGDNLIFLPVVQTLARIFPAAEILVATNEMAVEMFDPSRFRVVVARRACHREESFWRTPGAFLQTLRQIRAFAPDAAVLAHAQPNAVHLLAAMSGAAVRVGGTHDFLRTHRLTASVPINQKDNIALQGWAIAQKALPLLGHPTPPSGTPPRPDLTHIFMPDPPKAVDIVLHPGGSQIYKRWGSANFLALARRLAERWRVRVVASPGDPILGEATSGQDTGNVEFQPAANLRDLVTGLRGARLFVGNNSGPMHVAIALGMRSMIFTGPTPRIWDPYWNSDRHTLFLDPSLPCQRCEPVPRPLNHCANLTEPIACMRRLSVESALARCEEILAVS